TCPRLSLSRTQALRLLVTGLTGKVGMSFLPAFRADERFAGWQVRAICHNRVVDDPGVEIVRASIADADTVPAAMSGAPRVPDLAMDVGVKGMFNLLEAFRQSDEARQFMLISGDCTVGHIMQPYQEPITETSPRRPYPGSYALTKALEEAMLENCRLQYGINT